MMKLTGRAKEQMGVVLLYDPVPLEKVSLDQLKTHFPSVTSYLPEEEALTAESNEKKRWVQIFSARTEFVDQNDATEFSADALDPIKILLSAMPPLRVKAFGVNFHLKGTVEGYLVAGDFVTSAFVKDLERLETKLGAKIIASAQRFTYGAPARYYDVRVTPETLQGSGLHVQLHRHVEGEIADPGRLFEQLKFAFDEGIKELDRIVDIL
jgi:hypothetical protein